MCAPNACYSKESTNTGARTCRREYLEEDEVFLHVWHLQSLQFALTPFLHSALKIQPIIVTSPDDKNSVITYNASPSISILLATDLSSAREASCSGKMAANLATLTFWCESISQALQDRQVEKHWEQNSKWGVIKRAGRVIVHLVAPLSSLIPLSLSTPFLCLPHRTFCAYYRSNQCHQVCSSSKMASD